MKFRICFALGLGILILLGCERNQTIVPGNKAPSYDEVPTIKVENYVNRLAIDLLGREPVDVEMADWVGRLRNGGLRSEVRLDLVRYLMESTDTIASEVSYQDAYFARLYEAMHVRFLEGAGNPEVYRRIGLINQAILKDSLNGNLVAVEARKVEREKFLDIVRSQAALQRGEITLMDMAASMIFNGLYDEINMNSINFIRASFNDLFFRFHTQDEFDRAFQIIEFSQPQQIFGQAASTKWEYVQVLTQSLECKEGMVRWAYQALLAREPRAAEVEEAMQGFVQTGAFQQIQWLILVTDEYAGF